MITTPIVVGYMIGVIVLTLISAFVRFRDHKTYDWGEGEGFWAAAAIVTWPVVIPGIAAIAAIVFTCLGTGWVFSQLGKLHLKIGELLNRLFPEKEKVKHEPEEDLCESKIVVDSSET